jgi:hypothetical protein
MQLAASSWKQNSIIVDVQIMAINGLYALKFLAHARYRATSYTVRCAVSQPIFQKLAQIQPRMES